MSTPMVDHEHLPVIDVSKIDQRTGDELLEAASTRGFVYIRGSGLGLTPQIIEKIFDRSRTFFKSPVEEKAACPIGLDDRGWSSPGLEVLDPENQKHGDFKEALNLGEFVNGKAQQPLPKSLNAHQEELSDFVDLCRNLCLRLLRLFGIGLKVDHSDGGETWFSSRHDVSKGSSGSILRLLYYPTFKPTSFDEIADECVRAASHTDFGSMTLLFQRPGQPGLEIQTPKSAWLPVAVHPPGTENDPFPPIVLNIGDLLDYWTNGVLKSTVHRVRIPNQNSEDRYSIAYFCHPVADTKLIPVPSRLVRKTGDANEVTESNKSSKEVLTAKAHLVSRLTATYGWKEEGTAQPVTFV